ncbi:lipid-A-disaccharide synthase-related protein [Cyanobacterium sp. Dongsha4]|uniref:lipid-A-disaccharide synthase-related protein n=1 Tax=Cyanobacterium sp. DS4 TaxID=2878255 RepID=UPI002E812A0D|nr:lipid-A-disaccharide synthase-related protein [Cyanobacterium sp. Dongsha4]WVL02196.1 lipid-A-disaccharide synthase-related protein [Cyanobacterium sp. Dongsha4]
MVFDKNCPHKKILLISNGHGEDLNSSLIGEKLKILNPNFQVDAFPIVGEGKSYLNKNIPIVAPLQQMPSGGIFYLNPINFIKDLTSGLITLTIQQIVTINRIKNDYNFCVAVGDIVPLFFAYLTGKKFVSFLVANSSYYENRLKLPFLTTLILNSNRCLQIFTKDEFTRDDLKKQGFKNVICEGYPIMDTLHSSAKNLSINPQLPMIALLPGSRFPEVLNNLILELKVCEILVKKYGGKWQFYTALVSTIKENDLKDLALQIDWKYSQGILRKEINGKKINIHLYYDAFADILLQCNLVIGMAGTAVEQAVGLGKPVIQIPGEGPQFTYRFAEAQMRLLGLNVITVEDSKDIEKKCEQGADKIKEILQNSNFLEKCVKNGKERIGDRGASLKMAYHIEKLVSLN